MRKYINIKNYTEIESQAFTMIGASTKRDDDSKIGFFGSGLKYSIAVLLNHGIDFKVYSGLKRIDIRTEKETFRGQEFDRIYINGEKTSMTKQMGIDWKLWFCIREIYCNAMDEGKCSMEIIGENEILPEVGQTNFFIHFDDRFDDFFQNIGRYFSKERRDLMFSCGGEYPMKIFFGDENEIIYRRGVQCQYEKGNGIKSLYHYDCDFAQINESRVLTGNYTLQGKICYNLAKYATTDVARTILDGQNDDNFETNSFHWSSFFDYDVERPINSSLPKLQEMFFNNNWLDAINGRWLTPKLMAGYFVKGDRQDHILLSNSLLNALRKFFKDKVKCSGFSIEGSNHFCVEADERQSLLLERALDFLSKASFNIKYPIKICVFEKKNTLGQARQGVIYLSTTVFDLGQKEIVSTILEEAFHIESDSSDETREFQNYLINKVVGMMEEKIGVYL